MIKTDLSYKLFLLEKKLAQKFPASTQGLVSIGRGSSKVFIYVENELYKEQFSKEIIKDFITQQDKIEVSVVGKVEPL